MWTQRNWARKFCAILQHLEDFRDSTFDSRMVPHRTLHSTSRILTPATVLAVMRITVQIARSPVGKEGQYVVLIEKTQLTHLYRALEPSACSFLAFNVLKLSLTGVCVPVQSAVCQCQSKYIILLYHRGRIRCLDPSWGGGRRRKTQDHCQWGENDQDPHPAG